MQLEILKQLEKDIPKEDNLPGIAKKLSSKVKGRLLKRENLSALPPILQLNLMPDAIDVSNFKNPKSPSNPNGDYRSLYRFSNLANNISQFNQFYFPSGSKIDEVYENIVQGVSILTDNTFTRNAFFKSRQKLQNAKLANLAGTPDGWYPVYARPSDWFDKVINKNDLLFSEVDFSNPSESFNGQFTIIDQQVDKPLKWCNPDRQGEVQETGLNKNSKLNKLSFKFLQIHLDRPWFNFDLFKMGGWYLTGQRIGFVSSGKINENAGIFPLYPISFILATDLEILGELDQNDTKFARDCIQKNGSVNLGPFNINKITTGTKSSEDVMQNNGFFILAWISQLVDLSPKLKN